MRNKGIVLPDGSGVDVPSITEQLLRAIAQNQKAMYQALMGIQQQLEIQIRLECGADKRALWKERFQTIDTNAMLQEAAEEASFGTDGPGDSESGDGQGPEGEARLEVVPGG